jgi:hypothetical protein
VSAWLSLALGLVKLISWVTTKLSDMERDRMVRALVEDENLKADLETIAKAKIIIQETAAILGDDPKIIKKPDQDMLP